MGGKHLGLPPEVAQQLLLFDALSFIAVRRMFPSSARPVADYVNYCCNVPYTRTLSDKWNVMWKEFPFADSAIIIMQEVTDPISGHELFETFVQGETVMMVRRSLKAVRFEIPNLLDDTGVPIKYLAVQLHPYILWLA